MLGLALESFKDSRASASCSRSGSRGQDSTIRKPGGPTIAIPSWISTSIAAPKPPPSSLKLLVHEKPQSPLLPKVAVYLMNHRREGFYWYSTKQTAMVIYGLTDYLKSTGELKPNLKATVTVNGKPVLDQGLPTRRRAFHRGHPDHGSRRRYERH